MFRFSEIIYNLDRVNPGFFIESQEMLLTIMLLEIVVVHLDAEDDDTANGRDEVGKEKGP